MLSRLAISSRCLSLRTLSNCYVTGHSPLPVPNTKPMQLLLPIKRHNFHQLKVNFSISAPTSGIFDLWSKKESSDAEVVEKVYTFEDTGSTESENLEKVTSETNFDTSNIFESQNSGLTQNADLPGPDVSPTTEQAADFTGTVENLPEALTSFADFGLGGGIMPHRLFQDLLEYLTTSMGLEWIPAIAMLTIIVRILTVPGNIAMRKYSARSHNAFPETLKRTQAIRDASKEGNQFKMKKAQLEYMEYMRNSGVGPIRPMLLNMPNAIIFGSMFYGIRQICVAKFPTLLNGGTLWFTNLAVPDPFMILPLVSCVSMALIIRSGAAEAEMGAAASMDGFRKVLMWLPLVSLPFLVFQPAAMFAFWIVSNCFTVMMLFILRNRGFQRLFGIPERVKHDKSILKRMETAMNPIQMYKEAKKSAKERQELMKKVQNYQETIKKMQELEKKKKKDS